MSTRTQRALAFSLKTGERIVLCVIAALTVFSVSAIVYFMVFSLRQKLGERMFVFSFSSGRSAGGLSFDWQGTATVTDAFYSDVSGTVRDLQPETVALSVFIHLLTVFVYFSVAVAIIAVCVQLLRNRTPFTRGITVITLIAGIVLAVGGSALEILTQRFDDAVRFEITAGSCEGPINGCGGGFSFQAIALIAGLGIIAVAYMFHRAGTLQRETEGLV